MFFNGETDIGKEFDFQDDFNKTKPKSSGKGQYVQISLDIEVLYETDKILRWKKKWNSNGLLEKEYDWQLYDKDWQPAEFIKSSRAPRWLKERLIFRYVPAIKSPKYFEFLYSQMYQVLNATYSREFKEGTEQLISNIHEVTEDLSSEVSNQLDINNVLSVPKDIKAFFTSLDFITTIDDEDYSLTNMGDGIKARHIPIILKFLADNAKALKRGALTVTTIWGYEEPENNLEMKHAFDLARIFQEYSREIQIFMTTHSPAFYSLKEERNVSCLFLKRGPDNCTYHIHVEKGEVDLDEELGILHYITPIVEKVNNELRKLKEQNKELESKVKDVDLTKQYLVMTEDSADELKMIKAVMESNGLTNENTTFLSFEGKPNLKSAIHSSKWLLKQEGTEIKKIVFHIDRDIDGMLWPERVKNLIPTNSHIYITKGYDLDSLFVNKNHIKKLYDFLELEKIEKIIEESIEESKNKSLDKLSNGYWNSLSVNDKNDSSKASPTKIQQKVTALYNDGDYYYGKTVLGRLKAKMHTFFKLRDDEFNPYQPSDELVLKEIKDFLD